MPHFAPKAKAIIYLHMNGAPSQIDLWDYKPGLKAHFDKDLPDSVRMNQRLSTMTSGQNRFPVAPSKFAFAQHGKCGRWVSELLPHTAGAVDHMAVVKSVHTNAINHDPACTFVMTGSEIPGRPSIGSWLAYGLGSENNDLPAFVVFTPSFPSTGNGQALYHRLWGSGFLPTSYSGVALRGSGDPVLYLQNPPGVSRSDRRKMLDALNDLNARSFASYGDPEIQSRIAQYEMAFRMQASVPDLTDLSKESEATRQMYGPDVNRPGSFAHSALLARRLVERGVRVVQLLHRGWDQHDNLPVALKNQCGDTDQATGALLRDLKERGLLDSTLVVWGGEFGRTPMVESNSALGRSQGRDHHPQAYTIWMAGGGIKRGFSYGATDDLGFHVVENPVHVHDLQATILHCLGFDHEKLTYHHAGRDFRLTDVHGKVVKDILA